MVSRGIATFTLDEGKCPPWLFARMVALAGAMIDVIVDDVGPDEFVRRISDPVWFQSLGTVLAFDWNASGLTTILTAALKEAIRGKERELGIFICGGKGKTSRKTPDEIMAWSERASIVPDDARWLVYSSRMAAKVDSALVQDGYQIYHHAFMFSKHGAWSVVQQGMDTASQTARRYHWHGSSVKDFIVEPHVGIATQEKKQRTLNLTAREGEANRATSVDLAGSNFTALMRDLQLLDKHSSSLSSMVRAQSVDGERQLTLLTLSRGEFAHHPVEKESFSRSKYLQKILCFLGEQKPKTYEQLVATPGVGPKTVRALALVAEVLYGAPASFRDPARYSFAHGGKDATPYPIDRKTYDATIAAFVTYVRRAELKNTERDDILRRIEK